MSNEAKPDQRRARSEKTREKLLDAALHCYQELGVNGTAMEDVAQQAGVGRATLYRHFKNQEALLTEVMTRNLEDIQALLKTSLSDCNKPEEYFVEAAIIIIRECQQRSLTTLLFGDEASNLTSRISFSDQTLISMGNELVAPFYKYAKQEGVLRDWVTKPLLQEWISRLMLSFLTTPSPNLNSERKLRKFFYDAVVASIIERPAP